MCDFGKHHHHKDFGFLVDVPEIRTLIDQTRRLTGEITDTAARVEALRPAFGKLLAAEGWLPKEYGEPDLKSGMGGGIGQYALYRAEDGSLCLFSLVIPAGSETPIHDHLAWGLIGVYRGVQDETVYRRLDDGRDEAKANLEVARKLFELRTEAGLTQRQLAKLVGTSPSAVCRLEDADYEGHSLSMLRRIAAALSKKVEIRFVPATRRRRAA